MSTDLQAERASGALLESRPRRLVPPPGRNLIRLALLGCGVVNALIFEVDRSVADHGLAGALLNTFGISAIVWMALYFCVEFLPRQADDALRTRETALYLAALAMFLIPLEHVSWAGLSFVALGILSVSPDGSPAAKGGWILLAVTFPMFWSKLLFSLWSGILLQADAEMVSRLLGLPRNGNTIALADGHTRLFIAAPCTSFANVSLVVLCWAIFRQFGSERTCQSYLWCALACAAVIAINVGRIGLIGLYPEHYDLLHGAVGASVASWVIVATMLSIFRFGMNRGQ